jgi:lipopolysaccharide/colanic/teichoic acid biosynthesis glycosyltransferase
MAASREVFTTGIDLISEIRTRTAALDGDVTIVPELSFAKMLRLERRRAERSGKPFMLVLLRGWDTEQSESMQMVQPIAEAIAACTRETDLLGWYNEEETLGLLLTELGEVDGRTSSVIAEKLGAALLCAVGPEEVSQIHVSIQMYPPPKGSDEDGGSQNFVYRDLSEPKSNPAKSRALKRVVDIIGSIFALILFSPVFVIIAVLIKLTSRGPIFFSQKRVGQYGRLFDFYKFRSMYPGNDHTIHKEYVTSLIAGKEGLKQKNQSYKLENDPRITPFGKFIRRTSLDEIPQFLNVLKGDMSLVGPRPPVPYEFASYRPWHKRRVLEIQPGLTGLWQVKGRSRTTFDEMVRMDIRYAETQSLMQDVKIILMTPAAMFSGKGAQ